MFMARNLYNWKQINNSNMIKQYIKQAIRLLRENKLLSVISIFGTALAICMIMVIIILYVVKTAPFRPETNRSRTYYFTSILSKGKADNRRMSYGAIGIPYIKACILPLKSAEIVTIVSRDDRNKPMASTMDGLNIYSAVISQTDDVFWRLFDFDFIDGKAFTAADVKSEIKNAIISETVARKLFGTTHCTGKQIKLDFLNYRVAGVVRNVSRFADKAWADIWVPYTTMDSYKNSYEEGINGSMKCYVLLKKGYTWDDMHKEVLRLQAVYNATLKDFKADIGYQPRSQTEQNISGDNEKETNMSRMYIRYSIVLFVLLLVPVLNLSGITLSRMRRRMPELGVRRAYGATKWNILWQVLNENLVYTLIGGVIGLAFSYVAMFMLKDWLLMSSLGQAGITLGMFSWLVFAIAFFFCLLLNLLSAGIPAWRVSRNNITDSINS